VRRFGRRKAVCAALAAVVALVVAGCTGSSNNNSPGPRSSSGTKVQGGTATFYQIQTGPNYIFPFDSAAYFTQGNISYLQALLWRPLYWYGKGVGPDINYKLSVAKPPKYSNGNKTVTITLNNYTWSDGKPVTARDVLFWENLMKAEKTNWGAYTPGDYPDNIASTKIVNSKTIQFNLTKAYDTNWFTYNELSQITPLPQQAWDKTSASGKIGNYDMTTAGAKQVYNYLAGQSKSRSTYVSNPLWQTIDGPWRLSQYSSSTGAASFTPNPKYTGPIKPTLSEFDEKVYTDADAEAKALVSGSGPDFGYISPVYLKEQPALDRVGYQQVKQYYFETTYIVLNFNNPTAGPLFKQLYIRQAMQYLLDEKGIAKTYYSGTAFPSCGPIPSQPANSFIDAYAKSCPYSYNPGKAIELLKAHGWKVVPGGTDTCQNPGTGPNQCGAGIAAGTPLKITYSYQTGGINYPKSVAQEKSDAAKAGVDYVLDAEPYNTLSAEVVPCKASEKTCKWQMSGSAWIYAPDYYPTGESLFQTGAGYNSGSYSNPALDKLINASTQPGDSNKTLDAYQDFMVKNLPVLWDVNSYTVDEIKSNLHGATPLNLFGNITPEQWYFTK
jgi:peptide/nickel transport system substrate-binding protein